MEDRTLDDAAMRRCGDAAMKAGTERWVHTILEEHRHGHERLSVADRLVGTRRPLV
jgi:hypothetical protein